MPSRSWRCSGRRLPRHVPAWRRGAANQHPAAGSAPRRRADARRSGGLGGARGSAQRGSALAVFKIHEADQGVGGWSKGRKKSNAFSLEPLRIRSSSGRICSALRFHGNRSWLMNVQKPSRAMKRIWVPTLYVGVLTLVLAFSGMRWRWSRRKSLAKLDDGHRDRQPDRGVRGVLKSDLLGTLLEGGTGEDRSS